MGDGGQANGASFPGAQGDASLSGTVIAVGGAAVPNARVALQGEGIPARTAVSDSAGRFSFIGLPAGSYQVTVSSPGLRSAAPAAVVLAAGEARKLPPVTMALSTVKTNVEVTASPEQVAAAQVQLAEKQRVLGIIPNFYSSYVWNAAPLTPKLKFNLAVRSSVDPLTFMIVGGVAGVEQAHNTFPGYGSGPGAYGKRYGAGYADNIIGRLLGSAIFPSVFHQDPRYFYLGKGSVGSRALYAIDSTFITRGDNGRNEPNYSHLLGNFTAAGISNLYRAPSDRSASLTLRDGLIITGTNAVGNLVREFILRKITTKVPAFEQGKP